MTPPKSNDTTFMTTREMVSLLVKQQEVANKEFAKLSSVVYGDESAKVPGLVGDNHNNKKYIEKDKRFKWTVAGIMLVLSTLGKEFFHKIFG